MEHDVRGVHASSVKGWRQLDSPHPVEARIVPSERAASGALISKGGRGIERRYRASGTRPEDLLPVVEEKSSPLSVVEEKSRARDPRIVPYTP